MNVYWYIIKKKKGKNVLIIEEMKRLNEVNYEIADYRGEVIAAGKFINEDEKERLERLVEQANKEGRLLTKEVENEIGDEEFYESLTVLIRNTYVY